MSRHVCEIGRSSCQKPVCIWNEGPLGIFLVLKEEVAWQQELDPWRGPYSTVWVQCGACHPEPSPSWTAWIYACVLRREQSVDEQSEIKCLFFLKRRTERQFFWFCLIDWNQNMRKVSFTSAQTSLSFWKWECYQSLHSNAWHNNRYPRRRALKAMDVLRIDSRGT